jgi:hypothetical protein
LRILTKNLRLPEGQFEAEVIAFEESDRTRIRRMYDDWRNLTDSLKEFNARGINLPEGISESAFCLEMDAVRTTSSISGANSSWDCYDLASNQRIQVKACSVLPDLTSFGPNSQWDEIYFLDFYREGRWDGSFDIYKIETEMIYTHKVNQMQTFAEQQAQSRRPRFSIYSGIIEPNRIEPVKTGKL